MKKFVKIAEGAKGFIKNVNVCIPVKMIRDSSYADHRMGRLDFRDDVIHVIEICARYSNAAALYAVTHGPNAKETACTNPQFGCGFVIVEM